MAINTDGQKRIGRFLKKGSKLLSSVSMVEYNFDEIGSILPMGFDNPDRSIINARFHSSDDIEKGVKQHKTINEPLEDATRPRHGVIFPADFTQDWYNQRAKSKTKKIDDEDEEVDFAEAARARGMVHKIAESDENSIGFEDDRPNSLAASHSHEHERPGSRHSFAEVTRASELNTNGKTMTEDDMSSAISRAFTAQTKQSSPPTGSSASDNFTPLPTTGDVNPVAAEDVAIESWKNQQQIARQNEKLLEELKAEARAEGYQAGFREGEEKGQISGQKKATVVFHKVDEIIKEFEGLKSVVLENVQKNFYELSQAIGEALIGREFSIKPDAYAAMIQRVIKDTITPNEFKVRMHPDTWQKVHDLGIPDLNQHLIKDPTVQPGEFRVESNLTVVDFSAKKLVQQMLEKADIGLFDDKKAG